jgi:alpha-tubulin suppressor-like RCC1 family protein
MTISTLSKLRFNPRGSWVAATSYLVDDIVLYKNKYYACEVANSSSTTPELNTANWDLMGGGVYQVGEWSNATAYAVGDIITYKRTLPYNDHHNYLEQDSYICIQAGTNQNPATQTAYWKKISTGTMRDKFAYLFGPNEGYAPTYKTVWDAYALAVPGTSYVGMGDSFGEFKTPGTNLAGNGAVQYVNRRYGLMSYGRNSSYNLGTGVVSGTQQTPGESQFSHLSWFDGSLPTSPTTAAPKLIQIESDGGCEGTLVLFDNGEVHSAGYNVQGACGHGQTTSYTNFTQCGYAGINKTSPTTILRTKKAIRIASSSDGNISTRSCYALIRNSDDTRELYAWGYNGYGQLGQGNATDYYQPTLVSFDQTTNGKIIEIWATGGNYGSFWFLTDQGKMYAIGYNGNGQLGVGDTTNRSSPTFVKTWGTTSTTGIKKFNTGNGSGSGSTVSLLVIRRDNTLWTWGYNGQGQLGHNHTSVVSLPLEVYTGGYNGVTTTVTTANPQNTSPSGTKLTDVWNAWTFGGNYGSMYVTRGSSDSSNTCYSCGYNGYYQLSVAQASTTNYSTLQATQFRSGTALTNVVDLSANTGASSYTNVAVKRSDGDWYFCGYSNNGGAWAAGNTDTYNERQDRDPDNISANYRLKNNLLYPHAQISTYRSYWKYYPTGHSSNKFGFYVDLTTGRCYNTGYSNDYTISGTHYRGSYWNVMTKLKNQ